LKPKLTRKLRQDWRSMLRRYKERCTPADELDLI